MQQNTQYDTYSYRVPTEKVSRLSDRIEALSKKAVKLGMPAFTFDVSQPIIDKIPGQPGQYAKFSDVSLTGGVPILPGWRFVAKIEHDEVMNMVKGFGAQPLINEQPKLFQRLTTCPPDCDHCSVKRNRNVTYLFAETEDPTSTIQVGSSCVADFSGHRDPALLLSAATSWQDMVNEISDPDYQSGSDSARAWAFKDVIAAAVATVRTEGRWIGRDAAEATQIPTVDTVAYLLTKPSVFDKSVTDGDKRVADNVIEWLSDDDFDHQGQVYLNNLKALSARGYVDAKNLGLGASSFIAYKRQLEKDNKRQQERDSIANIRLGKIGEKIELTVKVEKIIPLDTQFGTTRLNIMRDIESNARVTWFNSGARKFMEGDTYSIKGRVKDFNPRDGIWQTQLSRVSSPDIKLQDDIMSLRYAVGEIDQKRLANLTKLIASATNPNCRNSDGDTIAMVCARLHSYPGDDYRPLIEASMAAGHDLSVPCPNEDLNAFDWLVVSEDERLIEQALITNPNLAERWDTDRQERMDIESSGIRSLLDEYRGETSGDVTSQLRMA